MNASDPLDVTIGSNLRSVRTHRRMSLEELGRRLGVTYQQIQKYETGKNRMSAATLHRAAETLGCSRDDLMPGPLPDDQRTTVRAPSLKAIGLAHKLDRLDGIAFDQIAGVVELVLQARAQSAGEVFADEAPAAPARAH